MEKEPNFTKPNEEKTDDELLAEVEGITPTFHAEVEGVVITGTTKEELDQNVADYLKENK